MLDNSFGNWMAGFIDGEGCFSIVKVVNRPGGFRPRFGLTVRADDDAIVYKLHQETDIGSVHYYTAQSGSRVVRWVVQSQSDCERLVALLNKYPLRAKKRRDFEVWAEAVAVASFIRSGRANNDGPYAELEALKARMLEVRKEGL